MKSKNYIEKELINIDKKEARLRKRAYAKDLFPWKQSLEQKVPPKIRENLEKGFYYAFAIVFKKGTSIIEKTYDKENLQTEHDIYDYAVQKKGSRREYRKLHRAASNSNLKNMILTTAEGIGLGALGIGMPDLVIFTGMILKGTYEYALSYGFDYDDPLEKMWILKMLEASVSKGDEWERRNERVDQSWKQDVHVKPTEEMVKIQMKRTAKAFAADMLFMKFVQGLPLVGILGGVQNPIYYEKIMHYVQVKYQRRYLMKKK